MSVGPGRAESISVGPVESGVRGGGSVAQAAEGKRGRVEPVLLLPRQRIFYSSTFVRSVPPRKFFVEMWTDTVHGGGKGVGRREGQDRQHSLGRNMSVVCVIYLV